jgi:hypothetical protein
MIPEVLPDYWNKALATPMQFQEPFKIADSEIRKAFTKLTKSRHIRKTHCFCFFIDGLDEFHETTQNDHKSITELLCGWANVTPGVVKLCISSREYNVFMNAFSTAPRLRLHDLTRRDMENFIQDKLGHIPDQKSRTTLVNMISERAQGIFLWVTLVVKSIREQIENGSTIDDLKEELETLPEELDGLFEHILKSLRNPVRKKAFLTLALLAKSKEYDYAISSFSHSFLDEFERNPEFAMADTFEQAHRDSMKREIRVKLAEKRLIGWLKGLVELDGDSNLDYTHRSVPEFLQTSAIKADMASITSRYNVVDVISQLSLAELRLQDFDSKDIGAALRVTSLVRLRRTNGLEKPPYSFLDCLGSLLNPLLWDVLDQTDARYELDVGLSGHSNISSTDGLCATGHRIKGSKMILSPLYIMTYLGYHEYPVWKILHDPITTDTTSKIMLLVYCCMAPHRTKTELHALPDVSVLRVLLERGILSPNTKTDLWSISNYESGNIGPEPDRQLTIWQHCLLQFSWYYHIVDHEVDDWHSQVFEAFLRHKPDLDFTISIIRNDDYSHRDGERDYRYVLELKLGKTQEKVLIAWGGGSGGVTLYEDLSPRQWIERSPLKDKECLLQLIDSQVNQAKSDSKEKAVMPLPVGEHGDQRESPQEVDQSTATPSALQLSGMSVPEVPQGSGSTLDQRFKYSRPPSGLIEHSKHVVVVLLLGNCLTQKLLNRR